MNDKKKIFPDDGELFIANRLKPSKTLIFFVHFLKGHKKALQRHIDFMNELGHDAYVFNLKDDFKDHYFLPYCKATKKTGLKHVLAHQIFEHLELFPEYKSKVIFAFSNISGCAIEAEARRRSILNRKDVKAFICDSGPGADFIRSSYNLFKHQFKINSFVLRTILSGPFALAWSPQLNKDIHSDLEKFPKDFPLLSIRGWRDLLITPESINKIFDPHKNLKWKKLNLPEAGHVNGLRDFPTEYEPAVIDFLSDFKPL